MKPCQAPAGSHAAPRTEFKLNPTHAIADLMATQRFGIARVVSNRERIRASAAEPLCA
jgi:hypothetical protein